MHCLQEEPPNKPEVIYDVEASNGRNAEGDASDQEGKVCNVSRRVFLGVAAFLVVGIAVPVSASLGVLLPKHSSNEVPLPLSTKSAAYEYFPASESRASFIANVLESEWNVALPWSIPDSPQFDAFHWLTQIDTIDLHYFMSSRQILERYVLAVLYFKVQRPPNGSDPFGFFLKPVPVCQWNSLDTSGIPWGIVGCSNGSYVTEIRICKSIVSICVSQ